MIDWYFCGSLRLSSSESNIGIPIYKNRTSNSLFIPETDNQLYITDFYIFKDFELYQIDYFCAIDFQGVKCRIGDPVIIPFWLYGSSQAIWGNIEHSELQIRFPAPQLGIDVLSPIRKILLDQNTLDVNEPLQKSEGTLRELEGLSNLPPSNTKYWINRFKFVSGRAPNSIPLVQKQLESVRSLAIGWLREWHRKGSFELSLEIMGSGYDKYLSRSEVEHIVFIQYVTRGIAGIGRPIAKKDLITSRRRFFKNGLLSYIKTDYRPAAHQALFDSISIEAPSYDKAIEIIENDFLSRSLQIIESGNLEDLLQLSILTYGDNNLPRLIEDLITRNMIDIESRFYRTYNSISYATPRTEKDHYELFAKSSSLAHDAWDVEILDRIRKSETRILGGSKRRIDLDLIENLKSSAERHFLLSRLQ